MAAALVPLIFLIVTSSSTAFAVICAHAHQYHLSAATRMHSGTGHTISMLKGGALTVICAVWSITEPVLRHNLLLAAVVLFFGLAPFLLRLYMPYAAKRNRENTTRHLEDFRPEQLAPVQVRVFDVHDQKLTRLA